MAQLIPSIGARGVYVLSAPFQADAGTVYTCSAVRRFVDLSNQDIDVYETYYAPYELPRSRYTQDRDDHGAIVTLTSQSRAPIYVPSSYIASYPQQGVVNYHHVVVSASLGLLADTIDLSYAQQQVRSALSTVVGRQPEVHVSVAPHDEVVTYAQHQAIEANRQAALQSVQTERAQIIRLQSQNAQLHQQLEAYERVLRHHGLLSE